MNPWIEHVRTFAANHQLSFACAVSNPKCKEEYLELHPTPEMILDSFEFKGRSEADLVKLLRAFKTVLRERGLLRTRLTESVEEELVDLAENLAFKSSVKTIMSRLKPILNGDTAFKYELTRALPSLGHSYTGSELDLINEVLESRAFKPLSAAAWAKL